MEYNESTGSLSVNVNTTSVEVIRQQAYGERVFFTITNTSTAGQVINLAFNQNAQYNKGISLSPGGFYAEYMDSAFRPTNDQIQAISNASGGTLSISIRTRVGKQWA